MTVLIATAPAFAEPAFTGPAGVAPTGFLTKPQAAPPGPAVDPQHPLAGVTKDFRPQSGERSTAERQEGYVDGFRSTAENVLKEYRPQESAYSTADGTMQEFKPKSISPADGSMKDYQAGAGPAYY